MNAIIQFPGAPRFATPPAPRTRLIPNSAREFRTISLIAKDDCPDARTIARQIRQRYPDRKFLAEAHLADALGWRDARVDVDALGHADLVVPLGGDGTLVRAVRALKGRPVPILGVNLGTLGFMTEVARQEVLPALDDVFSGRFETESRMKLLCRVWRGSEIVVEDEALNEMVISRGALARMTNHEAWVDGEYLTTYKSDGVIVCTPTGSTAYSLSAGGPIVHPSMDCFVVSPICPHTFSQRSIVLPADGVFHVEPKGEFSEIYVSLDGQGGHALRPGDRVEVQRSRLRVLLLHRQQTDYFARLREKLHWGER
jgi:NAD+ kinase